MDSEARDIRKMCARCGRVGPHRTWARKDRPTGRGYAVAACCRACDRAEGRESKRRRWRSLGPVERAYHYIVRRADAGYATLAPEWRGSGGRERFAADIGPYPSDRAAAGERITVDRKDSARGYVPGNVRWATYGEQARNRRNNVYLAHDGRRMLLVDWAAETGIPYQTLYRRMRAGLAPEDVLCGQ